MNLPQAPILRPAVAIAARARTLSSVHARVYIPGTVTGHAADQALDYGCVDWYMYGAIVAAVEKRDSARL
jgi:hypothetical protein